jgi:hypothetical protein
MLLRAIASPCIKKTDLFRGECRGVPVGARDGRQARQLVCCRSLQIEDFDFFTAYACVTKHNSRHISHSNWLRLDRSTTSANTLLLSNMPPHLSVMACDSWPPWPWWPVAFFQKGGCKLQEFFATIEHLIAETPIRPHLPKCDKAPLWIPRREVGYIVATCPECLRSFPVQDKSTENQLREVECPFCDAKVSYFVDNAVMEKRKRLATSED